MEQDYIISFSENIKSIAIFEKYFLKKFHSSWEQFRSALGNILLITYEWKVDSTFMNNTRGKLGKYFSHLPMTSNYIIMFFENYNILPDMWTIFRLLWRAQTFGHLLMTCAVCYVMTFVGSFGKFSYVQLKYFAHFLCALLFTPL